MPFFAASARSANPKAAFGSRKRLISHADAIRSMCGRGRVTHVLPGGGSAVRRRPVPTTGLGRAYAFRSRLAVVSQSPRTPPPAGARK